MGRMIAMRAMLLAAASAIASGGQDPQPVEIEVTRIAPHLHVLRGTYANMLASIGQDGTLLVDDDMEPLAAELRATLANLGGGEPRFILNTHWHLDHTGGNPVFGAGGAIIIAHENTRLRLSTPQTMLGERIEPMPEDGWPVMTYEQGLSLRFNGEEIRIVHYPRGHTDGDAVIFFAGSNVVHMGDLYFEGWFPNIDLEAGGDAEGYVRDLESILDDLPDDATIIPGHGPVSRKKDLQRFRDMLAEIMAMVRGKIEAGRAREAIIAEGVPERWQSLDRPEMTAERFLGTVYDSLAK